MTQEGLPFGEIAGASPEALGLSKAEVDGRDTAEAKSVLTTMRTT